MPLGDPVDQIFAVRVGLLRNRIADEFQDLVAGHDHGAAGKERVRRGDAAPQDAAVPDRRPFLRIQLLADAGVNAVGARPAARRHGCPPACRSPCRRNRRARRRGFGPVAQVMAGEDALRAEPLDRGVQQDLLQHAAMDRELRPFVAGLDAARLAPDRLAVLGEIRELAGRARLRRQAPSSSPSSISSRTACGSTLMPTPSGFSSETLSNTLAGNADLVQAQRQRQPADAAAGDEYGHDTPSLLPIVMAWERGRGQPRRRNDGPGMDGQEARR